MSGPGDQPLDRTPDSRFGSGPVRTGPPIGPIVIGIGLIVAFIAGGAWWMSGQPTPADPVPAAVTATEAPIAATPPPVATPPPLPPLDQMDPMMRSLLGALSRAPELTRWLATDALIQQLAAAIDNASQGRSSSRNFKMMAPAGAFAVSRSGSRRTVDPAGYRRYDPLVQAVTSIDASALVTVYQTIRPRLNEAYRNMGHPNGDVNGALEQALTVLIETPVQRGPIALVEGSGVRWAYDDPALESLSQTQKQLLRMGPNNVETLLVWLRAVRQGVADTR